MSDESYPTAGGLHHVSAIAGDPQDNIDFYTEVLGLHFVKQTVNFNDKFAYHLYYGDEIGRPGTVITFFPYERGQEGRVGRPQPSATAFTIPENTVDYWYDRLADHGVEVDEPVERFGEQVVAFRDHDGQPVELVATETSRPPITRGTVPEEYALRGLHSVSILSASVFHTASTLEVLGFELQGQEGDRVRYQIPGEETAIVDLLDVEAEYGREGIGTIHHVAFGGGDTDLEDWRERLEDAGLEPSWVKDRYYFDSLYVREPGGILFELATDEPGFTVDEDPDELGSSLCLPPWLEEDREMIQQQLPEIQPPE